MFSNKTQFEKYWQNKFSELAKKGGGDHQISSWTKEGLESYIKYFFKYFNRYIKKDNSQTLLLDLGCGPGTFSRLLSEKKFKVIGVDYSKEMIDVAKEKSQGIDYLVANVHNLPFDDDYFDIIICLGGFQYFDRPTEAIREIKRVLKENGLVIITTLNRFSLNYLLRKNPSPRRYNPYHFKKALSGKGFFNTRLKGIYFTPFGFLNNLIFKFRIYKFFNSLLPVSLFLSHSFYLEGRKR